MICGAALAPPACRQLVRGAGDGDVDVALQYLHEGVEWRRVFTQALTVIECEHRDCARGALHKRAADNSALLIGDQIQRTHRFGNRQFDSRH
jgi:hypothetical protein